MLAFMSPTVAQEASQKEQRLKAFLTCRDSEDPAKVVEACTDVLGTKGLPEEMRPFIKERRGSAHVQLKEYRQGLIDLANAKNPRELYDRAIAYLETGAYDDALTDADAVVHLMPQLAAAYNLKAWICVKMGEGEKGLADANRAIELEPSLAAAYDTRAYIYEKMARDPKYIDPVLMFEAAKLAISAIKDYRKAMELKPDLQESIDGLHRMGLDK